MDGIETLWLYFIPGFITGAAAMWAVGRMRRHTRAEPTARGSEEDAESAAISAISTPDGDRTDPIAHSRLIDVGAARAAGFNMKHADDLTIIEGIGPRIEDLLRANGVDGLATLAALDNAALVGILETGGASFRFANPSDWSRQAALAADNQWSELKQLQRERIADAPGSSV